MPPPDTPPPTQPPCDASTDAGLLPLVHAALRAPAWHLVFPAEVEARFEADHGRARSRQLVLAGMAALLVFDLFLINDWLTRPEVFGVAVMQRIGVMTGFSAIVLWLIHRGLPPRWREGLLATDLVLGMATSCVIFSATNSAAAIYDPFLFSLVFMAGNSVFPLRFRAALVSSVVALAVAGVVVGGSPVMPLVAKCFALGLMAATAVFSILACYRIERATRQAYLLLLQEELRSQAAQRMADEYALISQTDALTGLPNRRAFDAGLQQAWHEARLRGSALGLLLVDVDHFKRYNDHHGHPAGDECLRRVGRAMQASVREGDLMARIGGEEFALLLRDGRPEALTATATRLGLGVAGLALPHGGLERAPGGAAPVVTVSIGLALVSPQFGEDPQTLVNTADAALYEAKRRGRNRWWLAGMAADAPAPGLADASADLPAAVPAAVPANAPQPETAAAG